MHSSPAEGCHCLFEPQLILDFRDKIALTDEQAKTIAVLIQQREAEMRASDQQAAPESQALLDLLAPAKVDEQKALARIDRILALERQRRRNELLHLIRLKNVLGEHQQKMKRSRIVTTAPLGTVLLLVFTTLSCSGNKPIKTMTLLPVAFDTPSDS